MKTFAKTLALCAAGAAVATFSTAGDARADVASFYKGKTIKVVVRSSPGGGYDFYGRLIARHMPRHIPGNPEAIVVNMPGAGGVVATNYMMNRAKRDGTEIAIIHREYAISQRLKAKGVKYDVRKLTPIGSTASSSMVYALKKDHPVDTLAELKAYKDGPVKFSATGRGGGNFQRVMLLKLSGYPVRSIMGYQGTQERVLAITRGDVHGTGGSYESLIGPAKEAGLKFFAYLGNAHPDLKGVPDVRTGLTPDGRKLAALMAAPMAAGRPFVTAPGVPQERVAALRAGFKAALSDPKLLAEAKKADRSISWTDPKTMEEINNDIINASDEVIAQFKQLM
ncbi:MAG TPA: tripartite tricarboxylate transporter substrate-binding protein [Alphaproteobacteria bacterium]|nr:tripartite tricarboxylate transporter substrate-binding protein [Alphaproteobacteria bacterium]